MWIPTDQNNQRLVNVLEVFDFGYTQEGILQHYRVFK